MAAGSPVKFVECTSEKYNSLETKDENTLYFVGDIEASSDDPFPIFGFIAKGSTIIARYNNLTIDNTVKSGGINPISSGGVFDSLKLQSDKLNSRINEWSGELALDNYITEIGAQTEVFSIGDNFSITSSGKSKSFAKGEGLFIAGAGGGFADAVVTLILSSGIYYLDKDSDLDNFDNYKIKLSATSSGTKPFIFSHTLPDDADTSKTYLIPDTQIVPDFSKYFDGNFKEVNSVSGEEVTYKNAIVVNNIVESINADYVMGIFDSDSPTDYYSLSNGVLTRSYGLFTYKNDDTDWKRYEIDNKTTFKDNNWIKYFGGDYFETRIKYSKIKINKWLNYSEDDMYRPVNNKFDSYGLSLDTTQPVVSYKTYIYQDNKWTNIGNSSISELLNASLTEYTKTADLPVKDVQVNNKTVVDGSTKVAKISVPTKVSQLTNDSKFISQNIQIGGDEPTDKNILLWYDENDSGFVVQYPDGENTEF